MTQLPVHGQNLRYAVAWLREQGIPFEVQSRGGVIYIVVVPSAYAPVVQDAPWTYQQPRLSIGGSWVIQVAFAGLIAAVGSLICFIVAGNVLGILIWCIFALGMLGVIMFLIPKKRRRKVVP